MQRFSIAVLLGLIFGIVSGSIQAEPMTIQLAPGAQLVYSCAGEQAAIAPSSATDGRIICIAAPATPTPTSSPTAEPTTTPSPTTIPATSTPTPAPTATATVVPTSTPTSTPTPAPELSKPSANLAWFWRPGTDGLVRVEDIARRATIVALQKEDTSFLKALRAAGYKGNVLQYFLTLEVQRPDGIAYAPWGNNWFWRSGDWAAATDDMFLRRADGSRLSGPGNGMYYLDPASPKARAFVVARVIEAKAHGFDGLILDNLRLRWNMLRTRAGGTFYTGARQPYATEAEFIKAESEFLALIRQANGDRPLWANMIDDNFSGSSWDQFLPLLDGGMNESFATGWPLHGYPATVSQQNGMLMQAEKVLAAGKGFLAVGQGDKTREHENLPEFHQASWMLVTDGSDRASMRYSFADKGYGLWWLYPTYDLKCGAPLGPRKALASGWQGREFERCIVKVDQQNRRGYIEVKAP